MVDESKIIDDKNCKIFVDRRVSADGDSLIATIDTNDATIELLKTGALLDQFTVEQVGAENIKRYKIKKIIRNSISWYPIFNHIFTKEFFDNKKVEVKMYSIEEYKNFLHYMRYFKEVMSIIKDLNSTHKVILTYNFEEQK